MAQRDDSAHPDAMLLLLDRALTAAREAEREAERALPDDAPQAVFDALGAPGKAIVQQIIALPAHSLEGLRVKARAFLWCGHDADQIAPDLLGNTIDCAVVSSILFDLTA